MKYFSPNEFHGHFEKIDSGLLDILDKSREEWGRPVHISPAKGGVARTSGTGFHNYKRHGSVKAVDIMPEGFETKEDFKRAVDILITLGILGVGVYPDWKPSAGLHIDVGDRPNRGVGNPAMWSAFRVNGKQTYYEIGRAL